MKTIQQEQDAIFKKEFLFVETYGGIDFYKWVNPEKVYETLHQRDTAIAREAVRGFWKTMLRESEFENDNELAEKLIKEIK